MDFYPSQQIRSHHYLPCWNLSPLLLAFLCFKLLQGDFPVSVPVEFGEDLLSVGRSRSFIRLRLIYKGACADKVVNNSSPVPGSTSPARGSTATASVTVAAKDVAAFFSSGTITDACICSPGRKRQTNAEIRTRAMFWANCVVSLFSEVNQHGQPTVCIRLAVVYGKHSKIDYLKKVWSIRTRSKRAVKYEIVSSSDRLLMTTNFRVLFYKYLW